MLIIETFKTQYKKSKIQQIKIIRKNFHKKALLLKESN
jgi:hypothetical protein